MIEIVRTSGAGTCAPRTGGGPEDPPSPLYEPVNRQRPARRRLRDIRVHFLSLVPAAANQRTVLVKSASRSGCVVLEKALRIEKTDAARKTVYGVVYAPDETDTEGDTVSAEEIRRAAYAFMREGRTGQIDSDHDGQAGKGYVAESWIVRAGDPLFPDEPPGTWAVGVNVTDAATWQRIERGELRGLSMAGLARPEPLTEKGASEPFERAAEQAEVPGGLVTRLRKMLGLDVPERAVEVPALAPAAADPGKDALRDQAERIARLAAQLEAAGRQTGGRQTVLGGGTRPLRKDKGFKGIRII